MLKTMSAALLAVSVLAAPALATDSGKTAGAPVIKSTQAKTGEARTREIKTTDTKIGAPKASDAASKVAKTAPAGIEGQKQDASTTKATGTQAKPAALDANAKIGKHHHRKHISHRHGHQAKVTAMKSHTAAALKVAPKVDPKPATAKRG